MFGRAGLRCEHALKTTLWGASGELAIPIETIRHHRGEISERFPEAYTGYWHVGESWPQYVQGDQYYTFSEETWSQVLSLAQYRCRDTLLRVVLHVLPMLRAARAVGREYVTTPREPACKHLQMSSKAWSKALHTLETLGLITLSSGPTTWNMPRRPVTRILTSSVLAIDPVIKTEHEGDQNGTEPTVLKDQVLEQQRAHEPSSPRVPSPKASAALSPGEKEALEVLVEATQIAGPLAGIAAKRAGDAAAARQWVRQLQDGLDSAENPGGWFVTALKAGSAPGNPSYMEQVAWRAAKERRALQAQWEQRRDRPAPQPAEPQPVQRSLEELELIVEELEGNAREVAQAAVDVASKSVSAADTWTRLREYEPWLHLLQGHLTLITQAADSDDEEHLELIDRAKEAYRTAESSVAWIRRAHGSKSALALVPLEQKLQEEKPAEPRLSFKQRWTEARQQTKAETLLLDFERPRAAGRLRR